MALLIGQTRTGGLHESDRNPAPGGLGARATRRMALAMPFVAEQRPETGLGDAATLVDKRAKPRKGVATTVFHFLARRHVPEATKAPIVAGQ